MDERIIKIYRRMFFRSILLLFIILSLFIQSYVLEILMENNNDIFLINQYLIYLSNLIIFIYPFALYFKRGFTIITFWIDFIIRVTNIYTNINLFFDLEFYLIFYFWNFFNIMICLSNFFLLFTYENKYNLFPGKFIHSNINCPICMLSKSDWCLPCQHHFHHNCLQKWFKFNKSCPNCRKHFNFIN